VPARRFFFGLFTLLLLLILGWLGWAQWQLIQRQAAAPVVSVAEDGTVRIHGHVLDITADGLPGPGFGALEGGPPVRVSPLPDAYDGGGNRMWSCPRAGVMLLTAPDEQTEKEGDYQAVMLLGAGIEAQPATLEFRGQRWWLGPPGPLGAPGQRQMRAIVRSGDEADGFHIWQLKAGDAVQVILAFAEPDLWPWLDRLLPSHYHLENAAVRLKTAGAAGPAQTGEAAAPVRGEPARE